jgi:hypothetical protein
MILDAKPHGQSGKESLHQEDAMRFIVDTMAKNPEEFKNYGYDVYMTRAAERYVASVENIREHSEAQRRMYEISPTFFDAAWELCKRGIVRPGIRSWGEQMTDDGSAGNGFSLTPFGRNWLQSEERHLYVPTEPERFAELLENYKTRFGAGFHQRAQEALRCYNANAHLASCVMSGAAAESILLAVAFLVKDETTVLKEYNSSRGRKKVEDIILRGKDELRAELMNHLFLLKYWRDNSAHGATTPISEREAFTALAILLRLAQFVEDNWTRLTAK